MERILFKKIYEGDVNDNRNYRYRIINFYDNIYNRFTQKIGG